MTAPAKAQTEWEKFPAEFADLELVESDGENMDSDWHRDEINLLVEQTRCHFAARSDFFVGGNMFIYFDLERSRKRNFRGPDYFFVWGRPKQPQRRWWAVWEEGDHFPNVLIELLSPTTAREDRGPKFTVYERTFRTPEYFLYDPDDESLEGYRLNDQGRYAPLTPNEHGRLWSEELQLWLGTWQGTFHEYDALWLRFYHPDGTVVPLKAEAAREQADAARRRTETERQRAEAARQQAEAARQQAEAARQQAEAERQRAEGLEAELQRMRALFGQPPPTA